MALFPLHFFFTALYYTDTGSSLLVIGAHLLALRRAYLAAGLIAAAATAFRQTNAVWAAFTLAVSGLCVRLKSTPSDTLLRHIILRRGSLVRRTAASQHTIS